MDRYTCFHKQYPFAYSAPYSISFNTLSLSLSLSLLILSMHTSWLSWSAYQYILSPSNHFVWYAAYFAVFTTIHCNYFLPPSLSHQLEYIFSCVVFSTCLWSSPYLPASHPPLSTTTDTKQSLYIQLFVLIRLIPLTNERLNLPPLPPHPLHTPTSCHSLPPPPPGHWSLPFSLPLDTPAALGPVPRPL